MDSSHPNILTRLFKRYGLQAVDIPTGLVLYNCMLWIEWAGVFLVCIRYRPGRALMRTPFWQNAHQRLHQRSMRYQAFENWAMKTSESVAQWKIVRRVSTKYLKINPADLPYATLETVVFYNLLLIPIFFPINMTCTIAIISFYRSRTGDRGYGGGHSGSGRSRNTHSGGASGGSSFSKSFRYDNNTTNNHKYNYNYNYNYNHYPNNNYNNNSIHYIQAIKDIRLMISECWKGFYRYPSNVSSKFIHKYNNHDWNSIISELINNNSSYYNNNTYHVYSTNINTSTFLPKPTNTNININTNQSNTNTLFSKSINADTTSASMNNSSSGISDGLTRRSIPLLKCTSYLLVDAIHRLCFGLEKKKKKNK